MKKLFLYLIILVIFIAFVFYSESYANIIQSELEIIPDTSTYLNDNYINLNIEIKNISNTDENFVLIAYGIITYDTNVFEPVTTEDVSNNIDINPQNGNFTITFSGNSEKYIGTIKLKVKSSDKKSGIIKFSDLQASDGIDLINLTDKEVIVSLGETSSNKAIDIKINNIVDTSNTDNTDLTTENTNSSKSEIPSIVENQPETNSVISTYLIIGLCIFIFLVTISIFSIIYYKKHKKSN